MSEQEEKNFIIDPSDGFIWVRVKEHKADMQELSELRDWKAKAMMYIRDEHRELGDVIKIKENKDMYLGDLPFKYNTLTKLIKEAE